MYNIIVNTHTNPMETETTAWNIFKTDNFHPDLKIRCYQRALNMTVWQTVISANMVKIAQMLRKNAFETQSLKLKPKLFSNEFSTLKPRPSSG